MDCPAFAGLSLRASAIIIAVVGMLHWVACAVPARRFRSEFFILLYVLAAAAGLVSCFLLAGILGRVMWAYWLWIWFMLLYCCVMLVALLVMSAGFVSLQMPKMLWFPAVGVVFYLLMLYFICVVNAQRRSAQQPSSARYIRAAPTALRVTTPDVGTLQFRATWYSPERGRCSVPAQNPPHGEYLAGLPGDKLASRGRSYSRLRLWVYCDQYYRPRHTPHALCYKGGWNRPLPDCVRDKSFYEVYYEQYEYEETTTQSQEDVCLLPRPPQHGYFTRQATISEKRISLVVRCDRLHFLVGWSRISCQDGIWDRPMPKCMSVSESVCTLLKRTDSMIRNCMPSEHYSSTYRCDAGIVPHGSVVEPRCPRDHYVWGPFSYMFCIDGMWHPRTQTWHNLTCKHTMDIYRHYETTRPSGIPVKDLHIARSQSFNDSIKNIILKYHSDIDESDVSSYDDVNREKIEFFQEEDDSLNLSIWKTQNDVIRNPRSHVDADSAANANNIGLWSSQTDDHVAGSSAPNRTNHWKSESENHGDRWKSKSNKISIWKPLTSGSSSTSSNKINIWKSQSGSQGDGSIVSTSRISIWKPQNPGEPLNMISTNNNIWKSQDRADRSIHPSMHKINFKHLRKNAAKWVNAHSGKIIWRKTAGHLDSNRTKKAGMKG